MSRTLVAGLAALACLASPAAKAAESAPYSIGSEPAWYLLGGLTTGATVRTTGGYFLGGELSLARLHEGGYVGFYGDGYYDFGLGGTWATAGIELGKGFFGLDGGAAFRFANGAVDKGVAVRGLFSALGIFALYLRYDYFPVNHDSHVLQAGVALKLPLTAPFGVDR